MARNWIAKNGGWVAPVLVMLGIGLYVAVLDMSAPSGLNGARRRQIQQPETEGFGSLLAGVHLPEMIGADIVKGAGDAFRFKLPPGWRVVPIPDAQYRKLIAVDRYEVLLRPEVIRTPVPHIRISQLIGKPFQPETFEGELNNATLHVLSHFRDARENYSLAGPVVWNRDTGELSFRYRVETRREELVYARVYFGETGTLMLAGVFEVGPKQWDDTPFKQVLAGFRVHPRF